VRCSKTIHFLMGHPSILGPWPMTISLRTSALAEPQATGGGGSARDSTSRRCHCDCDKAGISLINVRRPFSISRAGSARSRMGQASENRSQSANPDICILQQSRRGQGNEVKILDMPRRHENMSIQFVIFGAALLSLAMSGAPGAARQFGSQRLSPPAEASCRFSDGKTITVNYSSPQVRGREIFGHLVPYDEVWILGANEATTFDTTANVTAGGK